MSAWGRLALIEAAKASPEVLEDFALHLGFDSPEAKQIKKDKEIAATKKKSEPAPHKPVEPIDESKLKVTGPEIPPAIFIAPQYINYFPQQSETPPELISGPTLPPKSEGSYEFTPSPLLMPHARYLPLLQNTLGQLRATRRVNSRKLSTSCAQGKTLLKVPRLDKQCWPQHLLIIVETTHVLEPYWQDFARIVSYIKSLLGEANVSAVNIDEDSSAGARLLTCWPEHGLLSVNTVLQKSEAILLLGDLGATSGVVSPLVHWLHSLPKLNRPIVCLNPAGETVAIPQICKAFKPNPLIDTRIIPRHTNAQLIKVESKEQDNLTVLVAAMAFLPVCDSALLRILRTRLRLGSSALEAKLWNHPHLIKSDLGVCVDGSHREYYQARYQEFFSGKRAILLWHLVEKHFSATYPGLRNLTTLMRYQAHAPTNKQEQDALAEAEAYLQKLAATTYQGAGKELNLAGQCKTALKILPEAFYKTKTALVTQLAAAAYRKELQQDQWPDELPTDLQGRLHFALGKQQTKSEHWAIRAQNASGDFVIISKGPEAQSPLPPLAELQVNAFVPPSILLSNPQEKTRKESLGRVEVFSGNLAVNSTLTLNSAEQELGLKAIHRPSWAKKMGYQHGELFAEPYHLGESVRGMWKMSTVDSGDSDGGDVGVTGRKAWAWHFPEPIEKIHQDQYGYYADIKLAGLSQRFRWIEPGTFMMGSPEEEEGRFSNEGLHQVTLAQGFWLADTALSQALWQQLMGNNPSEFQDPDKPVDSVSWEDAQACIQFLNSQIGVHFRLPTEAEWEYACRAGTNSAYSWGNKIATEDASFTENWVNSTVNVKNYAANPWGLYQMHGNVWEWCNDRFSKYPEEDQIDPEGPPEAAARVLRGGGWDYQGQDLRSAKRIAHWPDLRDSRIGFRLALGRELRGGGAANPADQHPSGPEARESNGSDEKLPANGELEAEESYVQQVVNFVQGAWFDMVDKEGEVSRCRLAAIIPTGKFIFVNRSAVKVAEKSQQELAMLLKQQRLRVLDSSTLFDRALENVASNLRKPK